MSYKSLSIDRIYLIILTESNYLCVPLARHQASEMIEHWAKNRETLKGTSLVNYMDTDDGKRVAFSSIDWSRVIGMYVKEDSKTAQERLVDLMERHVDEGLPGDEWKKDSDDEPE